MAEQAVRPSYTSSPDGTGMRWRTVDIVITAVLGVAFGVVFWAWDFLGTVAVPPVSGLLNGVFEMPGVVAALVVRKPGAAIFASTLAAAISLLLGAPYGGIIIVYGLVQGVGAELGFLLTRYRHFGWGAALLSGAIAGLSTAVMDLSLYYPVSKQYPLWSLAVPYTVFTVLSGMVLAGVLGLLLVRALARTGALNSFAAGRRRV